MGKGSKRRPSSVSDGVYALRYDLAMGIITEDEYNIKIKEHENVSRNSGNQNDSSA